MKKRVLVVGDLVECHHLANAPGLDEPFRLKLEREQGGACFLAELLDEVLPRRRVEIVGPKADSGGKVLPTAYFSWEPHPKKAGSKDLVWRLARLYGAAINGDIEQPQQHPGEKRPDLLVIDDGGLAFRKSPESWPTALLSGEPAEIILKTARPVAEGALWEHLRKKKLLHRLTVVLSAEHIRSRGASLSRALSWDSVVEDVRHEMEAEQSSQDLATCKRIVIHFGAAGVAWFESGQWTRLAYDPENLEGTWEENYPGRLIGVASAVTAAVTMFAADPGNQSLFLNFTRALTGLRQAHERGGGNYPSEFGIAHYAREVAACLSSKERPDGSRWAAAFPPGFAGTLTPSALSRGESNLLLTACGPSIEYAKVRALDVVLQGLDQALPQIPHAKYGAFISVDRDEIEGINGIRSLIQAYCANREDERPLAIAVFGPPGSGKSFAIKQLAGTLFPGERPYEFNLAQFDGEGDLEGAFHQVRDASVGRRIPLVFWDEFDSEGLRWLKSFLAPIQDKQFYSGGRVYPLGKAIFVFAGGTCAKFSDFDKSSDPAFQAKKGNDFVSRLRGHLNVKGPNQMPGRQDWAYLLRRATLLRSSLERFHRPLIHPDTKKARISEAVAWAFLTADRYIHGARSLETLVTMSRQVTGRALAAADLPTQPVLDMHVSSDFLDRINECELKLPAIREMAIAAHEAWREERQRQGWRWGTKRSDKLKTHPLLKPFGMLGEDQAKVLSLNWMVASLAEAKLLEAGFKLTRGDGIGPMLLADSPELADLEHDAWTRDKLLKGWSHARRTREDLLLSRDIERTVPPPDLALDRALANSILAALAKSGYRLKRVD